VAGKWQEVVKKNEHQPATRAPPADTTPHTLYLFSPKSSMAAASNRRQVAEATYFGQPGSPRSPTAISAADFDEEMNSTDFGTNKIAEVAAQLRKFDSHGATSPSGRCVLAVFCP